jgi:hypothetical protein
MNECDQCGRWTPRQGTCFACHLQGLSFHYRGAYKTRESFHNETIPEVQRQIEANPDAERIGQRWI